jgi:hypothetical protein
MAWLSHNSPETVADPTSPGVAELVAARYFSISGLPVLSISKSGANVILSWTGSGILQSATSLSGPWSDINDINPQSLIAGGSQQFFRVKAF